MNPRSEKVIRYYGGIIPLESSVYVKLKNEAKLLVGQVKFVDDHVFGLDMSTSDLAHTKTIAFDQIENIELVNVPKYSIIEMIPDKIRLFFKPESQLALEVVRDELLEHGDLYDGFLASIESSIKEQQPSLPYRNSRSIAEDILKRIIGEEDENATD